MYGVQDYDPLNSGRVTTSQFVRALDAMGLGAALRAGEARCAARHYADPADPSRVCWRTFEDDCDQGLCSSYFRSLSPFIRISMSLNFVSFQSVRLLQHDRVTKQFLFKY